MAYSFSKWLTASTAAVVLGLTAGPLAACNNEESPGEPDAGSRDADTSSDAGTDDAATETDAGADATPENQAPSLSALTDQTLEADGTTGELAFTVDDAETPAEQLIVTATSSNAELVPNDATHLLLGGTGANRSLRIVPAPRAHGSATITLTVSDGVLSQSKSFELTVTGHASLYWMTAAGSLWRVEVNGGHPTELSTTINGASSVATDPLARAVYYSQGASIVRTDSEGANPVTVVANGGYPSGLAIDATNRRLYWSDFNGKRVMRAELDGSNPTQIVGDIDSPSALAFDGPRGKTYVLTYNNTRLVRFDTDGSNQETIATGLGGLGVGLAVDSVGEKLYFSTRGNTLHSADLDGSNVAPLVANQTTVHGIAIDASKGHVFWADWLGQKIQRANLADGSGVQEVHASTSRNLGLAWMPAP